MLLLVLYTVFSGGRKMVWYFHLFKNIPQFVVIHTVKGFSIVNKAEIDVFLEFPCFFYDPAYVGNLISGSSVFFKSSLYIWKFSVHVLLKPGLKDFEHNFQVSSVALSHPTLCDRVQRNQRSNCQHLLDHRKSRRVPEKHLFLLY